MKENIVQHSDGFHEDQALDSFVAHPMLKYGGILLFSPANVLIWMQAEVSLVLKAESYDF